MSIFHRKDGRYIVKFKDDIGRWRQKGFRDRGAAEAFEGENLYDDSENKRLTVAESIILFLKNTRHCQQEKEAYALVLRRMGDMLATKYVDSLDRRDLENFRLIMKEEYGVAAPGINRAVKKLKAAFRWCASEYEPYREAISDADREIKEIDRQYSAPETGYTPEGERRTEEVISFLCRNLLPLMAKERGYRDPDYVNPPTGSVAPLSEWICDYFDDTPEEWGGKLFSDGHLEEAEEDDE